MNGDISRLFFNRILVAHQCAVVVLRLKVFIANFNVVSCLKRRLHCLFALVHWRPAGTRALVGTGSFDWRRGLWKGRRCPLAGTVATPTEDALDVGKRVGIAVLLFRLLLVHLGDDVVNRALSGAGG